MRPPLVRKGPIGVFRPTGITSADDVLAAVSAAIEEARRLGFSELMLAFPDMDDVQPPTLAKRHAAVRKWAQLASGLLRVAIVIPEHLMDAEAFVTIAAANFGLEGRGFQSEAEALDWLAEMRLAAQRYLPPSGPTA